MCAQRSRTCLRICARAATFPEMSAEGTEPSVRALLAASLDLLDNTTRGLAAEALIAEALGGELTEPWAAWDIDYLGHRIEVKATGDTQTWESPRPRRAFSITKSRAWNPKTRTYADEPQRGSDLYVFCHCTATTDAEADAVASWAFHAVPTTEVDDRFGDQKTVSLSVVTEIAEPVAYQGLEEAVAGALRGNQPGA